MGSGIVVEKFDGLLMYILKAIKNRFFHYLPIIFYKYI